MLPETEDWSPSSFWVDIDSTASGNIAFVVRDRTYGGYAGRLAFLCNTSAGTQYTVDWGDGNTEYFSNGAVADHTYTIGNGKPAGEYTTYKCEVSVAIGNITSMALQRTLSGLNVENTCLYCVCNATSILNLQGAFYKDRYIQAFKASDMTSLLYTHYMFVEAVNLKKVDIGSVDSLTDASYMFYNATALISINIDSASSVSNASRMVYNACSLQDLNLGNFASSASSVDGTEAFTHFSLRGTVNTPDAKYSVLYCRGTSDKLSAITSVTFSGSSTFLGVAPQINITYTMMDRSSIVALFNALPTVSNSQMVNITGSVGASDLTTEDRQIATSKGWTIVG